MNQEEKPPVNELERKYRVWRDANPRVMALFELFAMQMVERKKHFGIGAS